MKIIPDEVAGYINMTCDMDKRRENVVYEDDFFICVYDKLHKDTNDFHYTAWCKEDIRSLLDLERKHIPNILKMQKTIMQKFNLSNENAEIFIHFPPSYWRLHIHFVARPHIILHKHEVYASDDIVNNLTKNNNYYRTHATIKHAKM